MAKSALETYLQAKILFIVRTYAEKMITEMQGTLKAAGKSATGNLINSFQATISKEGPVAQAQITAADYAVYLDKGKRANTTPPPVAPLMQWIKAKGLSKGAKADRSFAYAMSVSIGRKAIKPLNFYDKALKKWVPRMRADISQVLTTGLEQQVMIDFKTLGNKITIK